MSFMQITKPHIGQICEPGAKKFSHYIHNESHIITESIIKIACTHLLAEDIFIYKFNGEN